MGSTLPGYLVDRRVTFHSVINMIIPAWTIHAATFTQNAQIAWDIYLNASHLLLCISWNVFFHFKCLVFTLNDMLDSKEENVIYFFSPHFLSHWFFPPSLKLSKSLDLKVIILIWLKPPTHFWCFYSSPTTSEVWSTCGWLKHKIDLSACVTRFWRQVTFQPEYAHSESSE